MGGSNVPQAFPNYLLCFCFIRINTVGAESCGILDAKLNLNILLTRTWCNECAHSCMLFVWLLWGPTILNFDFEEGHLSQAKLVSYYELVSTPHAWPQLVLIRLLPYRKQQQQQQQQQCSSNSSNKTTATTTAKTIMFRRESLLKQHNNWDVNHFHFKLYEWHPLSQPHVQSTKVISTAHTIHSQVEAGSVCADRVARTTGILHRIILPHSADLQDGLRVRHPALSHQLLVDGKSRAVVQGTSPSAPRNGWCRIAGCNTSEHARCVHSDGSALR